MSRRWGLMIKRLAVVLLAAFVLTALAAVVPRLPVKSPVGYQIPDSGAPVPLK